MSEVLLIILWEYQNVEKLTQRTHPSNRLGSTSILHRYVEDQISANFHVISTYFFDVISWSKNPRRFHVLFWSNFDGRKIHVVSTYFFRCNFAGRKMLVVSTYFFQCNFDGRTIHVVCTYLFSMKFRREKIWRRFWLSCKPMKTFEEVFLC